MRTNKRIFALLLACLFCLGSLAACSGGGAQTDVTTDPVDTTTPTDDGKWPEIEGTVIYVDPAAEDGDGSENAPFKSISEAQAKIREMKSGEGLPAGGITVLLASGEYSAMDTVTFTAEDSGTEACPITYMSAEKHGAVFTGGISLSAADFSPISDEEKAKLIDDTAKDKVLKADLTKYGVTAENVGRIYPIGHDARASEYPGGIGTHQIELLINGERMTLSRYPNESAEDPFLGSYMRIDWNDEETQFSIADEFKADVALRAVNWDKEDLWILSFLGYDWSSGILPLADVNTDEMIFTLGHKNYYGIKEDGRFAVINLFAETDVPGEYYIDRENLVLYVYPTEDFENSSVMLALSDKNSIDMSGVSYVTLSGLSVTATRANGMSVTGDHITVDGCRISGIRTNGINANGTDITVSNNEIFDIGCTAVSITGGDTNKLTPSGNRVYNNEIHDWSNLTHSQEYGIYIAGGCGTVVSHNEMYDGPHQAVVWDGANHIMEYNEVYNVCTETSDCGAFYSGRRLDRYGNTIRYNYIRDVGSELGQAVGIYYDDGLGGQTAYGNVIANTSWYGILACGRDNTIENNLIINCKDRPLSVTARTRSLPNKFYEHAIELAEDVAEMQKNPEWLEAFPGYGDIIPLVEGYDGDYDDPLLSSNPGNNVVRNNMYYLTYQMNSKDSEFSYQVLNMGIVENNLSFNDFDHLQIPGVESGDYTLSEDAEAYKNGFEKIPFEEIGRITEE